MNFKEWALNNKMISFSDLIEIDSWLSVIERAAVL